MRFCILSLILLVAGTHGLGGLGGKAFEGWSSRGSKCSGDFCQIFVCACQSFAMFTDQSKTYCGSHSRCLLRRWFRGTSILHLLLD